MNKKLVGIYILMLVMTTMASATNIGTQRTLTRDAGVVWSGEQITADSQPTVFDRGVDQQQTDNCGHGIILVPPWNYAQSFTPTKETLTAVRVYLFAYGHPSDSVKITVAIRDNLTHADLATKTIDTSTVHIGNGTKAKWVLFDFDDITVTPGSPYFIVCNGTVGDDTNAYCWFYNNVDTYAGGEAWIKPDATSDWGTVPPGGFNPVDFCFKTYFLKPFGSPITFIHQSGTNPWLLTLLQRFPEPFSILRHLMVR